MNGVVINIIIIILKQLLVEKMPCGGKIVLLIGMAGIEKDFIRMGNKLGGLGA